MSKYSRWASITVLCTMIAAVGTANVILPARAQPASRVFQETGHSIKGRFLEYWEQHGGISQQGYPISKEMQERSDTDGKTYLVQYMERAVFELHPENRPPYDVLLSLVGMFEYQGKYPKGAPNQRPNTDPGTIRFSETGKSLGGGFLKYWQSHGGLAQQGYPISDEFTEASKLNGKPYTVQYFQRAVFEYHLENLGTPYEVLLSQLGTFRYHETRDGLIIPQRPGRFQHGSQGSEDYLIWGETAVNPKGYNEPGSTDIWGIELRSKRPLPVTNQPGDQVSPSISGSTVVWVEEGTNCASNCRYDIMGKDLRTGETFTVVTGPGRRTYPVIAGRKIAWGENDQTTNRLMLKDLDTGETTIITSASAQERGEFYFPQLSEEYLVWLDLMYTIPDPRYGPIYTYTLRAYDLKTREARTVLSDWVQTPGRIPVLSLSGHKVVWDSPHLRFADLQTGETADLTAFNEWAFDPIIRGDTVFWISYYGELTSMKLPDRAPVVLVRDVSPGSRPTIAGDWLVWQTSTGRLSVARLAALLANPPTPIPTPVPTRPGLLPTPIGTLQPDLTPIPSPAR